MVMDANIFVIGRCVKPEDWKIPDRYRIWFSFLGR